MKDGDNITKSKGIVYHRYCVCCGSEIITNIPNKLYCSNKCRNKQWTKENRVKGNVYTRNCKCCGKEFETIYESKLYCNEMCQRKHYYKPKQSNAYEKKFIDKFNNKYGECFTYIEGYPDMIITIQCKKCGEIKTRNRNDIFSKTNISCRKCNNNRKGLIISNCSNCGNEYYKFSPQQILCSNCHEELERSKNKLRVRIRETKLKDNGKIEWNITLNKLVERDNNICQLCGVECNKEDYYIDSKGTFIAGNTYPSIDHIVPINKGGTHEWSNVQLAHRYCNSIKCDKVS